MHYKKILETFNKLKRSKYKNKEFDISVHNLHQTILNEEKSINYNKLKSIIAHTILLFLSLISVLIAKIKNVKKVNYFIVTDNLSIDIKSKNIIKNLNQGNYLNLIRNNNFIKSIYIFFKYKNVVFYQSIFIFYDIRNSLSNKKIKDKFLAIHDKNKYKVFLLKKIFTFLKIKKLITIDDYREMQIFIKVCKDTDVKSTGYQHARFSEHKIALSYDCYDNYIVWTKYFKKRLLKINKNYKNKIFINNFRNFSFKKNKPQKKNNNIIFFCEDYMNENKVINFLKKINDIKEFKLHVKIKDSLIMSKLLNNFLEANNITVIKNKNLDDAVKEFKPVIFLASQSNVLIEATLYDAIPIMLDTDNDYSYDLINENLAFKINLHNNLRIKLLNIYKNQKFKNKVFKIVWNFKNEKIKNIF